MATVDSAPRRRVLVVEDDRDIANLVQLHLIGLGCAVDLAHDSGAGLSALLAKPYDLVILDLMRPGKEGLDLGRRLRDVPGYTPILMLTARSSELGVLGLAMDTDDYLTKPFSLRELRARVKAILSRFDALGSHGPDTPTKIRSGDLEIDVEKRTVTVQRQPVELTAKEFDLLRLFVEHPGRVYTRAQLLDRVWGYGHHGYEHTVNSHINRLRGKIEKQPDRPRYILTAWGVGYKFVDDAQTEKT